MRRFILILITALLALGVWQMSHRGAPSAGHGAASTPAVTRGPMASAPAPARPVAAVAPAATATVATATTGAKPEVAIQDGKTIDFSSGTAVVKDDSTGQAVIAKSVTAMDSAAADVSFGPKPAAAPSAPTPAK